MVKMKEEGSLEGEWMVIASINRRERAKAVCAQESCSASRRAACFGSSLSLVVKVSSEDGQSETQLSQACP